METWIEQLMPLPRPEYVKQTESLLTDLIWRSKGSTLTKGPGPGDQTYFDLLSALVTKKDGKPQPPFMDRLIPLRAPQGHPGLVETVPIAQDVNLGSVLAVPAGFLSPIRALLTSILAPRSRGDRSLACVPVHPDSVTLQTLHGLVNKDSPPNIARAIEMMGLLGGSDGDGAVASAYLRASASQATAKQGLTGLMDAIFPALAAGVWAELPNRSSDRTKTLPPWPGVAARNTPVQKIPFGDSYTLTPFSWFFRHWSTLCEPANHWADALPTRRYVDWAMCLLRTGLAFSYLWEAEFFVRLHSYLVERAETPGSTDKRNALRAMFTDGTVLATFEPTSIPATQKEAWSALNSQLARGYLARQRFQGYLKDRPSTPVTAGLLSTAESWVTALSKTELDDLAEPLRVDARTPKTQREFVRYVLQPRSSDDDAADQADFYYLARTNSKRVFWFQPGPEWLVVVTSLLAVRPGGRCTLGMLIGDLAKLGMKVERWVLVSLLEEAGLSIDSPDADNALVIRAGF